VSQLRVWFPVSKQPAIIKNYFKITFFQNVHAIAEVQKDETDSSDSNGHGTNADGCIKYKCFWEGCKVYGKGSSSKSWLEKHVMSHGGNKPFQCIVDGCKHRFGTQVIKKYFFSRKIF
jgi:hypothetical protein